MRIYFDENFSKQLVYGIGEFQKGRRSEDIEVIYIPDEFGRGSPDDEWIPKVAQRHGCVITQDINISRTPMLWDLCKENKIGVFFFRQPKRNKYTYWLWVEEVMKHWQEIKDSSKNIDRPFSCFFEPNKKKGKY